MALVELERLTNVYKGFKEAVISRMTNFEKGSSERPKELPQMVSNIEEAFVYYSETFKIYMGCAMKAGVDNIVIVFDEHQEFINTYKQKLEEFKNTISSTLVQQTPTQIIISCKDVELNSSQQELDNNGLTSASSNSVEAKHSTSTLLDEDNMPVFQLPKDAEILYTGSAVESQEVKLCQICGMHVAKKNFRRHLKYHGLEAAKVNTLAYRARIRRNSSSEKKRICPLEDCEGLPPHARLDKHFKKYHKMSSNHEVYRKYIRVRQVEESLEDKYIQNIIENYKCHIMGVGGMLKETIARGRALKLKQILQGCEIRDVDKLTDTHTIETLEKWFLEYAKGHNPRSAKTYIGVFIGYIRFLKDKVKIDSADFQMLNERFNKLSRIIKRVSRSRLDKRKVEISETEVGKFHSSETIRNLICKMNLCKGETLTKAFHSQSRNFLMLRILFRSFCRSGAIANFTIEEYMNRESIDEEGKLFYTIRCSEHKTFETHGHANLIITEDLAPYMDVYHDVIRPAVLEKNSNIDRAQFFLNWSGKEMSADDVNKGIKKIWKDAGCCGDISANILRMSSTTRVHKECGRAEIDMVARLQCHTQSTAEKHYLSTTIAIDAVRASNIACKYLYDSISVQHESCHGETEEAPLTKYDEFIDNINMSNDDGGQIGEENSDTDNDKSETETQFSDWKTYVYKADGRGRSFFSVPERKILLENFQEDLEMEVVPTLSTIRSKLQCCESLKDICSRGSNIESKIKGSLLSMINKKQKLDRY